MLKQTLAFGGGCLLGGLRRKPRATGTLREGLHLGSPLRATPSRSLSSMGGLATLGPSDPLGWPPPFRTRYPRWEALAEPLLLAPGSRLATGGVFGLPPRSMIPYLGHVTGSEQPPVRLGGEPLRGRRSRVVASLLATLSPQCHLSLVATSGTPPQ